MTSSPAHMRIDPADHAAPRPRSRAARQPPAASAARVEAASQARVLVVQLEPGHDQLRERRGVYGALLAWLSRWLGPPPVAPPLERTALSLGAMRAFYEIGSDYLPSSGTWPAPPSRQ